MTGYGEKYTATFYDIKEDYTQWDVSISLFGYSGGSSALGLVAPQTVHEILSQQTHKMSPIKGMALNLTIYVEQDDPLIEDIKVSGERSMLCLLEKNSSTYWMGWLDISHTYSEPIQPLGFLLHITFTDHLGKLRNFELKKWNDNLMYDKTPLMNIVSQCLYHTGFAGEITLWEGIDLYPGPSWVDVEDSPLVNTWIEPTTFYNRDGTFMSCYETLEIILTGFGARLWQESGHFWIVPIHLFKEDSYVVRKHYWDNDVFGTDEAYRYDTYDSAYSNIIYVNNLQTVAADRNLWVELSGRKELEHGYKNIVVKQLLEEKNNIVWNGDFQYWKGTAPKDIPVDFYFGTTGNNSLNATFVKDEESNRVKFTVRANYNEQDSFRFEFPTESSFDMVNVSIRYTNYNSGYDSHMIVMVRAKWSSYTYYLHPETGQWQSSAAAHNELIEASGTKSGTISFESTEHLPGVDPVVSIIVTCPYDVHTGATVFIDEVSAEFSDSLYREKLYKKVEYPFELNSANTEDLEHETRIGEAPSGSLIINDHLFFHGILWGTSGFSYASYFTTLGTSNTKALAEWLMTRMVGLYNFRSYIITGDLMGHLTPGVVIVDQAGRRFIIDDYSHNLGTSIFSVTLLQISGEEEESGGMWWTESSGPVYWTESSGPVGLT